MDMFYTMIKFPKIKNYSDWAISYDNWKHIRIESVLLNWFT